MVHRREIDGRPIVLGNQGALWGNAMTWFDHETGSVWSQPLGQAIMGPLSGTRLELLPSTLTTWGDWTGDHPESLALDAPGGFSGFDLETMAVVVELGDDSVAHPVPDVRAAGVANSTVDGVPVAVHLPPGTDNWVVVSRRLDDRVVTLTTEAGEDGVAVLAELDGPGRWDPVTGLFRAGTDESLDRLPGFTSFPADYVTFFPDGAFWQPDGPVAVTGGGG
jgi:hypothetical protein